MSEAPTEPTDLKHISNARAVFDVLGVAWKAAPGALIAALAEPLGALGAGMLPLVVTWLVDAITGRHLTAVEVLLGVLALLCSLTVWTPVVGTNSRITLMRKVGYAYDVEILGHLGRMRHLDDLDDPTFKDHTQLVTERSQMLSTVANQWLIALRYGATVIVLIIAGLAISPWLLLIPLALIPALLMESKLGQLDGQAEDASAPASSGKDALLTGMIEPNVHDEVQLWGAGSFLRGRVSERLAAWRAPYNKMATRRFGLAVGPALLTEIVGLGVMTLLVWQAINGRTSVGVVAGALLLVTQLQTVVGAIPGLMQLLLRSTRAVKRALWLRDYAERQADAQTGRQDASPSKPARASRFVVEHLSYTYPGADTEALTDVSIELPVGGAVALVGVNGSGKTTFLDLLLGLRRPTSGSLGWVDAAGQPVKPRAVATFQDYVRYEAPLRDNVAFGDWPATGADLKHVPARQLWRTPPAAEPTLSGHDTAALGQSLDQVELGQVQDDLSQGLDTLLGSRWDDSHGLSGGQWQRVAIARCMYPSLREAADDPTAPQIRVLDEASSALDAHAEERLRGLILGAALPGDGVTIYVTHRFPIIRAANLILVFQNGRLVEQGAHDDLLARNGAYAELFNAQARGYQEDAAAEAPTP